MSDSRIEQIPMWRTRDGKLHHEEYWAEQWDKHLTKVYEANELLEAGATVADALERAGQRIEEGSPLHHITSDTRLTISYWQGRSQPWYKVISIRDDLSVRVWGPADDWWGSYGAYVGIPDLERYARNTMEASSE